MTYKEAREYLIPIAANCVLPQYAAALEKAMEALELAQADKEGRVVVLPCKVGDTVYRLRRLCNCDSAEPCDDCKKKQLEIVEEKVAEFSFLRGAIRVVTRSELYIHLNKFGKTVFLTREEAEAALKGEQG